MSIKNIIKQLLYMFLPAIFFRVLYGKLGIPIALIISISISGIMILYNFKKYKKINNSLIIGFCLTLFSLLGCVFSGNDRFIFYPAVLENFILVVILLICIIKKRSYSYFFAKDFEIPYIKDMDESVFLPTNYAWLLIFSIRLSLRVISLLSTKISFNSLYWVSFLAGDPITIPVYIYTYYFFRKKIIEHCDNSSQ